MLEALKPQESIPWLCVGDFNEILKQSEKFGAARRLDKHIESFKIALETCGI